MEFFKLKTIKMLQTITSNWHLMRIIRFVLSIAIIIEAWSVHDKLLGMFGLLFLGMSLFNVGCCSTQCTSRQTKIDSTKQEEISYEEIK
jgi:hypothetical protein